MAQQFVVHPQNPQLRLLKQAADLLADGGVLAVPTDSSYALVARLDDKAATDAMRRLRGLDARHHLTLLCQDLTQISHFATVDNAQYRLLKLATPGAWTFILHASREVPRRVSHPSRKTIGIRIPDHPVTLALIAQAGSALISTTLIPHDADQPLNDAQEIVQRYGKQLAGVVDGGACPLQPTTVVDLTGAQPQVLRLGRGDINTLGLG